MLLLLNKLLYALGEIFLIVRGNHLAARQKQHRKKTMKWISIKDKLPENSTRVIACSNNWVGESFFDYFNDKPKWYTQENCCLRGLYDVSHWMPLPELPDLKQ